MRRTGGAAAQSPGTRRVAGLQGARRLAHEESRGMLARHREMADESMRAGIAYLDAAGVARARYAHDERRGALSQGPGAAGDPVSGPTRPIARFITTATCFSSPGRIDDALGAVPRDAHPAYRLDLKTRAARPTTASAAFTATPARWTRPASICTPAWLCSSARVDDARGVASSIDDIGKLHWLKGEYREAEEALRDALTRRRALADRRSIALSLRTWGSCCKTRASSRMPSRPFPSRCRSRREIRRPGWRRRLAQQPRHPGRGPTRLFYGADHVRPSPEVAKQIRRP